MIRGLSSANLINSSAQIFLQGRLRLRLIRFGWVALLFFQVACNNAELKEPLVYTGPLRKAENIELYYSEKDQVKVKMVAAEMQEFESGDREFPKGIYMEFYDEFGMMESTLRANQAYFFKKENQWRGRGKVEVKNIAKNEQLNTEELFWKPGEEKIFTEKFVTIRQQGDVIYGQGLEAKQDMSDYTIKNPQGDFEVKEE
jgi:LPS export ABC transporter protein LptC